MLTTTSTDVCWPIFAQLRYFRLEVINEPMAVWLILKSQADCRITESFPCRLTYPISISKGIEEICHFDLNSLKLCVATGEDHQVLIDHRWHFVPTVIGRLDLWSMARNCSYSSWLGYPSWNSLKRHNGGKYDDYEGKRNFWGWGDVWLQLGVFFRKVFIISSTVTPESVCLYKWGFRLSLSRLIGFSSRKE